MEIHKNVTEDDITFEEYIKNKINYVEDYLNQ